MAAIQYNRIIRKLVVAFGNLFNDIKLVRYNPDLSEAERFLIPIAYATKERYVMRLEDDLDLDKKVQVALPRFSFEMTGMNYDSSRKQISNIRNFAQTNNGVLGQYNPVPYDFDFSLYLYVRNIEDATQVLEHILPYFTPDYTMKINMIPEMGVVKEVPVIFKDAGHEIIYEGDRNQETRMIIWTLRFTVKGYLYGPVSEPKIIRSSITNILDDITLHDKNIVFNMSSGFGNYKAGETVYQGYSYETATATAKVSDWLSAANTLTISDLSGHFVTNANVIGSSTNSTWRLNSYKIQSSNLVNITITPNPSNVVLPNNYTYTTTVTEFPNT